MKQLIKTIWILALTTGLILPVYAQADNSDTLALGSIAPLCMEVTFDKTSHLIFPAAIRYVDLGSDYLIASKAEDAENVLRVKAAVRDFNEETNFSVITTDGQFYSFNVLYAASPEQLSYNLINMNKSIDKQQGADVLFEELGNNSPSLTGLILETIYRKNKRMIKHIGAKSYGILFVLKGIYIHDGKYYFHTEIKNRTNIPFIIDFISFKIRDKKIAKRTVIQERPLTPLRIYKPLEEIGGKTTQGNVFLLDAFTISDDKILLIEVFEKNGGRQQTLQVEYSDLNRAHLVSDLHLKFSNLIKP
ncbi:conjugative transposon protein TraN [Flavobacterium sp.]|uniref:conjugative transposon protein TraN n=1 Tax=Flavobacterium sp. TaxID=239 RepID=UPI003A913C2B